MNHLFRELAPISEIGWQEIEKEAQRTLKTTLAARKLVDFVGPLGWQASAVGIGRGRAADPPARTSVETRLREVLPLVELRVPFELERAELNALDRGAKDFDTIRLSRRHARSQLPRTAPSSMATRRPGYAAYANTLAHRCRSAVPRTITLRW